MQIVAPPKAIISAKCRFCGKWRHPREFVGDSTVGYCHHCYEWHQHALAVLTGTTLPRGCQECGLTYEQLEALSPTADVRMCLHPVAGIWAVFCGRCSDELERKTDLYRRTPYGQAKKL